MGPAHPFKVLVVGATRSEFALLASVPIHSASPELDNHDIVSDKLLGRSLP
jgi:hypothetical protein